MAEKHKLDLALRTNRGKRILVGWTHKLTRACGRNVLPEHFLSLEQTDALKEKFLQMLKTGRGVVRRHWPRSSFQDLADALKDLCIEIRLTPVVLFSSVDDVIGAVQLPANMALLNFPAVWEVVEQDFRLTTPDLQNGLCVEVNFYDTNGDYIKEGIYELVAWGMFANIRRSL